LLGLKDTNATALQGSLAQTGAARDVGLAQTSAARDVGLASIAASEEVANAQTSAQIYEQQSASQAQITAAQITAGVQRAINDSNAATEQAAIQANENNINFQTQASKDIARAQDNTSIVGGLFHLAEGVLSFFVFLFMALPAGVTLGAAGSDLWGAAYYEGQKIAGVVNGQFYLADGTLAGSATDADWQAIADAENAQFATQAHQDFAYQEQIDSPTTSPEVRTLLQNPEWKALQGTGPINWNTLSDSLKSQIQAIPNLYNSLIAGAWTPATDTTTQSTAPVASSTATAPVADTGITAPSSISRLMDVVASSADFTHSTGGGVGGGGAGGGGGGLTIAAPVAGSAVAASGSSNALKFFLLIGIVIVGVYFYHKHKKAA